MRILMIKEKSAYFRSTRLDKLNILQGLISELSMILHTQMDHGKSEHKSRHEQYPSGDKDIHESVR